MFIHFLLSYVPLTRLIISSQELRISGVKSPVSTIPCSFISSCGCISAIQKWVRRQHLQSKHIYALCYPSSNLSFQQCTILPSVCLLNEFIVRNAIPTLILLCHTPKKKNSILSGPEVTSSAWSLLCGFFLLSCLFSITGGMYCTQQDATSDQYLLVLVPHIT